MSTEPLFDPFTLYDGLCTFAILVGSMIAAGGGLGGGGVFVPIYILVLSFSTKHAAALSQATILGGSIVNLIMNWRTHHPKRPHRPLTDFPTLLVFEPMLLVGTVLGVLLNVIFPAMVILILLIVTLVYATIRTTRKGFKMWNEETLALEGPATSGYITNGTGPSINNHNKATNETSDPSDAKMLTGYDTTDSINMTRKNSYEDGIDIEDNIITQKALIQLADTVMAQSFESDGLEDERLIKKNSASYGSLGSDVGDGSLYTTEYDPVIWSEMAGMCGVKMSQLDKKKIEILSPLMMKEKQAWIPMIIVGIIWIISSSTSLGKNVNISGVEACSALYWVITFLSFPILLAISLYITKQQYDLYDEKERSNGWIPAQGDIKWNESMMTMVKYPLIATIAGLLGGLLGIGGGMIVSPL
eukprot:CAMPEP_0201568264 /NCGR_PEP_ID=MMETSP0190_2-20130828/9225_1 /ASSEMBLY_ACC=CAM_ASM_000263 /TAXON_ID=37353 /ORGANISM="Rosalina sp." /LENGTH=415 /DNA_ID=CAMNT_0047989173 /DNA_START=56 /DNA_END=1300 /DNA_ORIENTATION=+